MRSHDELLLVLDAYKGLFSLNVNTGELTLLVDTVDGRRITFGNDLDVSAEGVVYFTDSDAVFERRHAIAQVMSGSSSGRFMSYDLHSGQAKVLLQDLPFPNGVTLSHDRRSVLVALCVRATVLRYDLHSGAVSTMALLPGGPDNIRRRPSTGTYLVALGSQNKLLSLLASYPKVREVIFKVLGPERIFSFMKPLGMIAELNEDGDVLRTWQDSTGRTPWLSEAHEHGDYLYLGSWRNAFLARIPLSKLKLDH